MILLFSVCCAANGRDGDARGYRAAFPGTWVPALFLEQPPSPHPTPTLPARNGHTQASGNPLYCLCSHSSPGLSASEKVSCCCPACSQHPQGQSLMPGIRAESRCGGRRSEPWKFHCAHLQIHWEASQHLTSQDRLPWLRLSLALGQGHGEGGGHRRSGTQGIPSTHSVPRRIPRAWWWAGSSESRGAVPRRCIYGGLSLGGLHGLG